MKKLLTLCLLAITIFTFAQTKKVAILEPVDRVGDVSYASKLILRSNLAKAVTDVQGYEAYDRSDMDAIMGEQNFQRTGMVSDEQIKRLGIMTGASYILVSEAAKVDDTHMFITAKILNVESAKTEITDNFLMGTTATDIQYGCEELAAKLFNVKVNHSVSSPKVSSSPTKLEPTKAELSASEYATIFLYRAKASKNAFLEINGKDVGLIAETPGCTQLRTTKDQVDLVAYVGKGDLWSVKEKGKRISYTIFPEKGDILCFFILETMGKCSFYQIEGATKTMVIAGLEGQSNIINIDNF